MLRAWFRGRSRVPFLDILSPWDIPAEVPNGYLAGHMGLELRGRSTPQAQTWVFFVAAPLAWLLLVS